MNLLRLVVWLCLALALVVPAQAAQLSKMDLLKARPENRPCSYPINNTDPSGLGPISIPDNQINVKGQVIPGAQLKFSAYYYPDDGYLILNVDYQNNLPDKVAVSVKVTQIVPERRRIQERPGSGAATSNFVYQHEVIPLEKTAVIRAFDSNQVPVVGKLPMPTKMLDIEIDILAVPVPQPGVPNYTPGYMKLYSSSLHHDHEQTLEEFHNMQKSVPLRYFQRNGRRI